MTANLSQAKKALLQKWLDGQLQNNSVTISKRKPGSSLSISFPQQWQLFFEMLQPGTAVNNLSVLLEINGRLDVAALQKSANKIVSRHDSLRTCFLFSGEFPQATITKDVQVVIPVTDLQELGGENGKAKAKLLAETEVLQPFDLTKAPLFRLRLYALNEGHNLLLATIHHTIADGWSMGVFLNELLLIYQYFVTGIEPALPELEIQYPDFALWQTDITRFNSMQTSLEYWKQQLGGELPVLEMPNDHPRSTKQSFAGGTYRFRLSKVLADSLETFCKQHDVSLFMTLMTAYNILLHRYSAQDEILVGTPVANRNLHELENLIGVFINTVVLRTNMQGAPNFLELLRQVKTTALNAYAHQDYPFEKLVEELKPKRDLSRNPIFQTVFNLQNSPMPEMDCGELKIVPIEIDRGVSQFDLSLMVTRSDEGYNCTVEYNSDLFLPTTICRIFDSFQMILQQIVFDPRRPISKIEIVDGNYLNHVICDLNNTKVVFPRERCFDSLFEEQVTKTPDSCAIIYEGQVLTYLELNDRVNKLARYLQSCGVTIGTRVGVLMEKALETTEALIAVIKTGGTYVPLSSTFPQERIKFILEDAEVDVVITNIDIRAIAIEGKQIVDLREKQYLTISDGSNLEVDIEPNSLAYIIYTSGSTGFPKGVMVQHSALLNFIYSMQSDPGIKTGDVLLSVTSISFDIAALELFLPLTVGGAVVIAGREITANPLAIGEAIEKYSVNIMQATPAIWQLVIDSGWKGRHGLKALCGGDVLTRKLADQILKRTGCLWNMYGPTEATIWCSVNQIIDDNSVITIGRPVANNQLYILDKYLQPVPIGVTGELHIGGAGLAAGYLNQDELNSKKFIAVSLKGNENRLYKTGDMARYLPDFSIEIIGRLDYQVKLNGHRIELGEISSVLLSHPLIRDAVVIVKLEQPGDKKLLAFYVSKTGQPLNVNELQQFAGKKLPAYMVPAAFIYLNEFPLTASGKIDRLALPTPTANLSERGYVAPASEVQEILVDIWQTILQVDRVGVHDNFFDLGGASIQTLQVVASASLAGIHLSPEMIFEHQTVAELSACIEGV